MMANVVFFSFTITPQGKEFLQVFKIYVHGVCKIFPWVFSFVCFQNLEKYISNEHAKRVDLFIRSCCQLIVFLFSLHTKFNCQFKRQFRHVSTNQSMQRELYQQLATAKDVMLYLRFTGSWQQETTGIASKPVMTTTIQEFLHCQLQSEWAMFKTLQPFRTLSPVIHTSSCQTLSSVKGIAGSNCNA